MNRRLVARSRIKEVVIGSEVWGVLSCWLFWGLFSCCFLVSCVVLMSICFVCGSQLLPFLLLLSCFMSVFFTLGNLFFN